MDFITEKIRLLEKIRELIKPFVRQLNTKVNQRRFSDIIWILSLWKEARSEKVGLTRKNFFKFHLVSDEDKIIMNLMLDNHVIGPLIMSSSLI